MASLQVLAVTSFFLMICMHFSNARILPAAIVNPSSAKPLHFSISLQVSEKTSQIQPAAPATPFLKGEFGELLTGNPQNKKKIDGVFKEGSEIVESSSSHHVALQKGKHTEVSKIPSLPHNHAKEEVFDLKINDDIVVMDYQPPRRKTPIHNK